MTTAYTHFSDLERRTNALRTALKVWGVFAGGRDYRPSFQDFARATSSRATQLPRVVASVFMKEDLVQDQIVYKLKEEIGPAT
jgi:hypothetical protein